MMEQKFNKQFMTLPQAAEYLGLSKSCLYKKTFKRELPFFKPGNKIIYFKQIDLDDFAFSNRQASITEMRKDISNSLTKTAIK